METTNKICHQCGEEIKKIAKKCPYCQSWQKGFNSFFVNQPAAASLVAIIPMIIFIVWMTFFSDGMFGGKKINFAQYQNLITVQHSTSDYKKDDDKTYITTVGTIKNSSDKQWKNVYIEVQYFNEIGALTDTQSNLDYGLILSPNSETSFRVRQEAAKDATEYKTHKVIVKNAEDAKSRW